MDGLTTKLTAIRGAKRLCKRVWAASIRWVWNVRQYGHSSTRSFGAWEWGLVIVSLLALASMGAAAYWQAQIDALEPLQKRPTVPSHPLKVDVSSSVEAKQRLQDFEQMLIAHDKIPQALGDLLQLAEDEGLLVRRADYRPDEDGVGHFMRYRIQMPIKGTTEAIQRFLRAALQAQRNLILESVQLKRETSESNELDANVQWVLLTQLPPAASVQMKEKP
jgi:Tfp pilus assembly protein PilO